jgi:hypothetical protein
MVKGEGADGVAAGVAAGETAVPGEINGDAGVASAGAFAGAVVTNSGFIGEGLDGTVTLAVVVEDKGGWSPIPVKEDAAPSSADETPTQPIELRYPIVFSYPTIFR